ncbi:MAG: hypothetical protein MJ108_08215 [Saccharofermentans sp.]|nr:hypothetical protein [Saccharofermentans sp.]
MLPNKKQTEQKCYDLTKTYVINKLNRKTRKYINDVYPILRDNLVIPSERPDFIVNSDSVSYAIEHFMVDFCNDGVNNNQSESMLASKEVSGIFNKYHDPDIGTIKDADMEDAVIDIESEVNKIKNIASKFDYDKYVEAFTRTFQRHYKNISEYKKNDCLNNENIKMGFLIEFHCDTDLMQSVWNGSIVSFPSSCKSFPLTEAIKKLIEESTELDFVIISQFSEGVFIEASDVKIYEPNNMAQSIEKQRVRVYDRVIYPDIKKHITLNLEKNPTE